MSMRTKFNGFHSDLTVAVAPREAMTNNVVPLPVKHDAAMADAQ
jgi:hypothetical protein